MNKNIKGVLVVIIVLIVVVGAIFLVGYKQNNQGQAAEKGIVLYYGDGCPHCAVVDAFIKENKVEENVSFDNKEVWNNKDNQKSLAEKVVKCGLSQEQIGVPFLWDQDTGKCLTGDVDIINFFKQKIGL